MRAQNSRRARASSRSRRRSDGCGCRSARASARDWLWRTAVALRVLKEPLLRLRSVETGLMALLAGKQGGADQVLRGAVEGGVRERVLVVRHAELLAGLERRDRGVVAEDLRRALDRLR